MTTDKIRQFRFFFLNLRFTGRNDTENGSLGEPPEIPMKKSRDLLH